MEASAVHPPQPDASGAMIVRDFIGRLDAGSTLLAGTQAAQEHVDVNIEMRAKMRTQLLYHDLDNASEPFHEAEFVRKALESASNEFFKSLEKKRKESKFGLFQKGRPTVEIKVEQHMRQINPQGLDDVKDLVMGMADEWKKDHGKVYNNFARICQTLDAHKDLFKIVPSQNTYVSVLSGALSMVVQASVYHAEIAENLSSAVAHLCERVAVCSQLLHVIRKNSMQRQLAEIYKRLFFFLLETAKWFNKSGFSRFFNSFNKAVIDEHNNAITVINRSVDIVTERGQVEGLLRLEDVRLTSDIVEWKVDVLSENVDSRLANLEVNFEALVDEFRLHNHYQRQDRLEAGSLMLGLLLEQMETWGWERIDRKLRDSRILQGAEVTVEDHRATQPETLAKCSSKVSRGEADIYCKTLRALVHGTDGVALAQEKRALLADMNVINRLGRWIQEATDKSRKLWVDFPFEFQEDTSARMAALGIISIAARANAPFISYICRKPNAAQIPRSQSVEEAGMLSMVYSLILQLLRFRPQDDGFEVDPSVLSRLNEGMGSWKVALDLLNSLLEHTLVVRYCIIHGLNDLETGLGQEGCKEFLEVLFSQPFRPNSPLSFLFTTSGQSRVLFDVIAWEDRARSEDSIRSVEKRGEEFGFQIR